MGRNLEPIITNTRRGNLVFLVLKSCIFHVPTLTVRSRGNSRPHSEATSDIYFLYNIFFLQRVGKMAQRFTRQPGGPGYLTWSRPSSVTCLAEVTLPGP